jgi:type IV secretory pathway VirB4 component
MVFDWIKRILGKLLKKSSNPVFALPEIRIKQREPKKGELALGWAFGYDEKTDEKIRELKGIDQKYRATHFYVIGASGTGKTRFLEFLIQQDIRNGEGFGVIDPHGDLIEDIKGWLYIYSNKLLEEDIVLIEPTAPEKTITFNPLEQIKGVSPEEQAGKLVEVFKKIWWDAWGARMESILRNSLIALVESNLTLAELPLLLSDSLVRKRVLKKVKNPTCLQFFIDFEKIKPTTRREWIESTLNKVDAFLSDRRIRNIIANQKSSFNLREIIDNRKILLVKLERGRLTGSADLLGSLLLSKIQMAAFSRTDLDPEERVPFYLYIDEFQNFATQSFIETLSEARKYRLSLTLAHQNLSQLPKELQDSILANCGIVACFRVSRKDAEIMAKELLTPLYKLPPGWEINVQEIQELPDRFCFVKNKSEGGIIAITTEEVPEPWRVLREITIQTKGEFDSTTKEEYKKRIEDAQIGIKYLRDRAGIEREYKRRIKKLTAEPKEPETFREPKK